MLRERLKKESHAEAQRRREIKGVFLCAFAPLRELIWFALKFGHLIYGIE